MDYAKKEVRIVNESEIETYILENEFNNDLKLFLLEYGFISPDCDFMVVDELKIRIQKGIKMISFEVAVFIHIYFILLFFVFALNELTNIIIELYINLKNKIRNKIK